MERIDHLMDKLRAIGDEIRRKTGKTEPLTLDQMPIELRNIRTVEGTGEHGRLTGLVDKSIQEVTADDLEGAESIGDHAFRKCDKLTWVDIPDGAKSIGEYAFYGCSGMDGVSIPESVMSIGQGAFGGCSALKDIYFGGNGAKWQTVSKGSANIPSGVTMHYAKPDNRTIDIANHPQKAWSGTAGCYVLELAGGDKKTVSLGFVDLSLYQSVKISYGGDASIESQWSYIGLLDSAEMDATHTSYEDRLHADNILVKEKMVDIKGRHPGAYCTTIDLSQATYSGEVFLTTFLFTSNTIQIYSVEFIVAP